MEGSKSSQKPNPMPKTSLFTRYLFFGCVQASFIACEHNTVEQHTDTLKSWLAPLFRYGYKHTLEVSDMYEPLPEDRSKYLAECLSREWEKELKRSLESGKKARLLSAIRRVFWVPMFGVSFFVFLEEIVIKLSQPILISILVEYFNPDSEVTRKQAYLCATGMCVASIALLLCHSPHSYIMASVGMRIRVATSAMIYRKALRLSSSALKETTIGQLVNILSNDVNRFDRAPGFFHFLWASPIQMVVLLGILWSQMGPSCLVAFLTLFLMVPIQSLFGKMFSKLRAKTALLTDKRVRLMNEIISGMRVIKIQAWEESFMKLVTAARNSELKCIFNSTYLRAFNLSFFFMSAKIVAFTTFTVYTGVGNVLSPSILFLALSLFDVIRITVTLCIPYSIMFLSEALISIKRIEKFLEMDEIVVQDADEILNNLPSSKEDLQTKPKPSTNEEEQLHVQYKDKRSATKESAVEPTKCLPNYRASENTRDGRKQTHSTLCVKELSGSWYSDGGENVLDNISFTVNPGELVAIIGPVGAGKSSLLMALLNELPHQAGHISCEGCIAYTPQQPWVFSGTLQENVLFGEDYDKQKYEKILKSCALTRDINLLPKGDLTLVGERGVTLSGGQRARVNLARAVYNDADVYILDDPLSAVDTAVGRHLFEKCIRGSLGNKAVLLITHQLQYLSAADKIIILKEGKVLTAGTFEELQSSGVDFTDFLQEKEDEDCDAESVSDRRSQLSLSLDPQKIESEGEDVGITGDYEHLEDKEDKAEGTVGANVYVDFFMAGIGAAMFLVFTVFNVGTQVNYVFFDWWLSEWAYTEDRCTRVYTEEQCLYNATVLQEFDDIPDIGRPYYFYISAALILGLIVLSFTRTYWLFYIMVNSSRNLHTEMLTAVMRAPMRFFDTNPSGRVLNRFSKDLGYMDEMLPVTFCDFNEIAILTLSIIITICIFNPVVLIFTIPLGVLFVLVRTFYLSSSRDVKRIEGICRSPMFSHLSATLQGLSTIRAFNRQDQFVSTFDEYQDLHTSSWFVFISSISWFGLALELLCAAFISATAFTCILLADVFTLDAAEVGLSLTYSLTMMSAFQWGVRQSAEIENLMTSTERVIEYSKLQPEATLYSNKEIEDDWPKKGTITVKDLSLRYSHQLPYVLKEISLEIKPCEKVGIVGRTGAGKSSLTVALMRLVEPEGAIIIDGINIQEIGLHELRKTVSFIPQDPILFSGTLRRNLDPFSEHSDEKIWRVLEEVQLKSLVDEKPEKLNMDVEEGGTNFSVGQRQLLCLARAILRENRVLIVDEATANVDLRTDDLIQSTIRDKFRECTVLTIAHRLNTVMDSHRVLVLEEGKVIEFDEPYILLQNPEGFLAKMVMETGQIESERLMEMAKQSHFNVQLDDE